MTILKTGYLLVTKRGCFAFDIQPNKVYSTTNPDEARLYTEAQKIKACNEHHYLVALPAEQTVKTRVLI